MSTVLLQREVPTQIRAAVTLTLVVEAVAIPTFLYVAIAYGGTIGYVAALGGAAAAACAVGTLAGNETARKTLMALAAVSIVLAALPLPLILLVMPVGQLLLADALVMGSSAIVLALLWRTRPTTAPTRPGQVALDLMVTAGLVLLSIVVLISAGLGLVYLTF
ncbi:hypothetical protein [Nocardioides sp. WS12]|uniref:hypothetical protein n=1 Tax=Nocardioides sp. WS12 TaxID=2486272 RepID=UPI0015FAB63D|nr:hypothetical protein [Nocardioides sp. WS12]